MDKILRFKNRVQYYLSLQKTVTSVIQSVIMVVGIYEISLNFVFR